jgi:ribonuclease-3
MARADPLVPPVLGHPLTDPHAAPLLISNAPVAEAEAILGHRFARPDLLREALTHRSAAAASRPGKKGAGSNERLEFVGDRVLGLLIAEWLAERFPHEQEGALGRRLAHLVSQPVLAAIAEHAGLPAILSVAPGESRAGVRRRATVLADATEATLGALYIDGGITAARRFVRRAWDRAMTDQAEPPKDAKTALQEWAQGRGLPLPAYALASRLGPSHAPVFEISVTVAGKTGTGTAGSKRAAEQEAAHALLEILKS